MRIVGLIAEYNPFHNGHQLHIEQALKATNADAVIVVMSGNFVQRGAPAIMPKHLRTEAALKAGASLVLELPTCYATGSAEYFAYGAVSLLHKIGCVDAICFGSECGDIEVLKNLANVIHKEPKEYKNALNYYLKQGNSFPLARQLALKAYFNTEEFDTILSKPNNILGLEYLKSLYRLNSHIEPYTIKRVSSAYHDEILRKSSSSATAIRKELIKNELNLSALENQVPKTSIELFQTFYQKRFPICLNDFSMLLKYKILTETAQSLTKYADVSMDLANRIVNFSNEYLNFEQFCQLLKTKELTHTRITRALIHILLNIRVDDYEEIEYTHILGFSREKQDVLTHIKVYTSIPLVTKLVNTQDLTPCAKKMLEQDIFASNLYESVVTEKFGTPFINEYQQQIVIV